MITAAGPSTGRGHLGRQLAVAEHLIADGLAVDLVLRHGELSPGQAERVRALGIQVGAGRDAAATIVDLADPNETVGAPAERLVLFDDGERFAGSAAIVIQPSMPAWTGPPGARAELVLAGFDYVPIAMAVSRAAAQGDTDRAPYLVVCFGGSDPSDVSARIGPALAGLAGTRTVVVVGADYRGSLRAGGADDAPDVRRDPAEFIDLLAGATLVVTSAGTLKFELAVLGRPMLLLAVADDQLATGPAFAATGAARYLGDGRLTPPSVVRSVAEALLADPGSLATYGRLARSVVDGQGGRRIARAVGQLVGLP